MEIRFWRTESDRNKTLTGLRAVATYVPQTVIDIIVAGFNSP